MVEVAVEEVETKDRAVEVAVADKAPDRVIPPLAVKRPEKVEAPATDKVDERLAAPLKANVEDKVAAPETVKGAVIEVVPFREIVSEAPPPKEAFWAETVVKEPKGALREEPTTGPVDTRERVEIEPEDEMVEAEREEVVRLVVVMDWGLKDEAVKVPLTLRSLLTVRLLWKTALSRTERVLNSVFPVATVKDLVLIKPSEIIPDRAWMVLAVSRVSASVKVK